ncbi:MAG: DnaJ domain-containing protein [Verrucomicrobiae bacterium]|nr:DnaJ domain-containing protein [Verrucomicrobiae bacterium]
MTDYFALLNEPRRPALEVEALKERFLKLSSSVHPDRFHHASAAERQAATERYAELNAAFQCLSEPKERLLHLYELETGQRPKDIQRIPPGTMDLFVEVGQLCRDVDAFLAERAKAESPMVKVQLFARGLEWVDKLQQVQAHVNAKREELLAELEGLNAVWEKAPPPGDPGRVAALPLERLEQIYRVLSYIQRWSGQLQERLVQLSL